MTSPTEKNIPKQTEPPFFSPSAGTGYPPRISRYSLMILLFWTAIIGASFMLTSRTVSDHAVESARIQARTAFEKDVIYRRWNSDLGGVYAPRTEKTPSNPYLDPQGRDFHTPMGLELTKINPAYMTRLVHEMGALSSGVIGHITSNKPIRPENKPDPWEAEALGILEKGEESEVSSVEIMNGQPYMRLMGALTTEKSCLNCHAAQGYREGEVRGGISVSVPMGPLLAGARQNIVTLSVSYGLLWLIGVLAVFLAGRRLSQRVWERDRAAVELSRLAGELERRVAERTAALEKSQAELQAFMDNSDAGMFLKNRERRYVLANREFSALIGQTADELMGKRDDEIMEPYLAEIGAEAERKVLESGEKQLVENISFSPESDKSYSSFMFPVLKPGSPDVVEGFGAIIVDISRRRQMEEALIMAKEAAESANKAKSDFLANISHEIRTPLNGVIGMAELLLRSNLSPDHLSMVATIKNSGDSLLGVLNDILDFSKIEAGKLQLEILPFNLRELVYTAASGMAGVAHKKGLELNVRVCPSLPDGLLGDAVRIRQILLNLIGNAVKFTDQGEVNVNIDCLERSPARVKILLSVADTGIGVPEGKKHLIFSAFEQSDTSITRKYGGTGLGLPISQRLAELMGSGLRLESRKGQGSVFSLELELPVSDQCEPERAPGPLEQLRGLRALVVDDNPTNRYIMAEYLKFWKIEAVLCDGVDEALKAFRASSRDGGPPHLLLTDLQMPGKDGAVLIRQLLAERKDLAVILLSSGGLPPEELLDEYPQISYLEKPVKPDDLLLRIFKSLRLSERAGGGGGKKADKYAIAPSEKSLNILMAEDVDINQKVAQGMLSKLGHRLHIVSNGQEALEAVKAADYDVIMMDIQMPVMDGISATGLIRLWEKESGRGGRVPIVAMTAHAMKGDREKYLESGMDYYISKPIRLAELAELMNELIRRHFAAAE